MILCELTVWEKIVNFEFMFLYEQFAFVMFIFFFYSLPLLFLTI